MNEVFKKALRVVLDHEGGFVNDPSDPGGATNMGITWKTYQSFLRDNGEDLTEMEVVARLKTIPTEHVESIYFERYWEAANAGAIQNEGEAIALFNMAVNQGPGTARLNYEKAVKETLDDNVKSDMPTETLMRFMRHSTMRYASLMEKNHSLAKFANGWINRGLSLAYDFRVEGGGNIPPEEDHSEDDEVIGKDDKIPGVKEVRIIDGKAIHVFKRGSKVQLTKNFSSEEFDCREDDGSNETLIDISHVYKLQALRKVLGKPIVITSAYRNEKYNTKIRGAKASRHIVGDATDIQVPGIPPKTVADIATELKFFGGIGRYPSFTHLDSRRRDLHAPATWGSN